MEAKTKLQLSTKVYSVLQGLQRPLSFVLKKLYILQHLMMNYLYPCGVIYVHQHTYRHFILRRTLNERSLKDFFSEITRAKFVSAEHQTGRSVTSPCKCGRSGRTAKQFKRSNSTGVLFCVTLASKSTQADRSHVSPNYALVYVAEMRTRHFIFEVFKQNICSMQNKQ